MATHKINRREEICQEGVVSLHDAAELLGIHLRTLYDLMYSGKIAYTRSASKRKIPRAAITEYLAANLVEATR